MGASLVSQPSVNHSSADKATSPFKRLPCWPGRGHSPPARWWA